MPTIKFSRSECSDFDLASNLCLFNYNLDQGISVSSPIFLAVSLVFAQIQ